LFQYYTPFGDECGPKRQCDFGLTYFALTVKNIHQVYERLYDMGFNLIACLKNCARGYGIPT
jgi:hypothetical protein